MANEITTLILDLLTYCGYQECPRVINGMGELVYNDSITYIERETSYRQDEKGIQVIEPGGDWYYLRPEYSLDHSAFLLTRVHNELHNRSDHNSRYSEETFEVLHGLILHVQHAFVTLRPAHIVAGLQQFVITERQMSKQ